MKCPEKWKRFWFCCRWGARACRITLLLIILSLVSSFVWLNQVGMPDFAKTRLQEEFKSRGLEIEFQRMYWTWFKGIVTEDLTIRPSDDRIGPSIAIQSADIDLDLIQLAQGEFRVRGIELFQGNGRWEVAVSNEPARLLTIKDLRTDIRFLPNDLWQLTHFSANIQGIDVTAAGVITNASLARRQSASIQRTQTREKNREAVRRAEARIHRALTSFGKFKFAVPPTIDVKLNADARERGEIDIQISGHAKRLDSPYGACRQFSINGQIKRAGGSDAALSASLFLDADAFETARLNTRQAGAFVYLTLDPAGNWNILWDTNFKDSSSDLGEAEFARFEGTASADIFNTNEIHSTFSITLDGLKTAQARIGNARMTATIAGNLQDRHLRRAEFKGRVADFARDDLQAQLLDFDGLLYVNPTAAGTNLIPALQHLAPWKAQLRIDGRDLRDTRTRLKSMSLDLKWAAPELRINSLVAELPDGTLRLSASANTQNRLIDWQLNTDFSLTHIAHLLGPKTEKYIKQYNFKTAPSIDLLGTLRFPEGDLKDLKWKQDLEPSLTVAGNIAAQAGDYRALDFLTVRTDLTITNQSLVLPNLLITRPEGNLHLNYTNHLVTRDYAFGIDSLINPLSIAPLLGSAERNALAMFEFHNEMPLIKGTLWGRWGELERTGFEAITRMTNIALRAQEIDRLATGISYTNFSLVLTDLKLERPEGTLWTKHLLLDTAKHRVYLTNLHSSLDFMVIPSIIGSKTAKAVANYHFQQTPTLLINGEISTHRNSVKDSDLHFDLVAPHFHWFKFNLTNATAHMDWVTNRLFVTNLHANFYDGTIDADLFFDFDPPVGNDFTFDLSYTNAQLRPLIADLSNPTNLLEGSVSGDVHVTSGNTRYWDSWQGHGNIMLTNAILWDIPVFGIVSSIMNRILPGLKLGNSRAKEAAGKFVMTNSTIYTRNLIIQSPPVRLYYNGTIDFDANINARVEAKLFRDKSLMTWLLDAFTAPITKILEHRVTGTLSKPKTEPINELPILILSPLNVVGEILQSNGISTGNNKIKRNRKFGPSQKNGGR